MVQTGEQQLGEKEHRNAAWDAVVLDFVSNITCLLDTCYGLLGAEDIGIKMNSVPALWRSLQLEGKAFYRKYLLPFATQQTTPNLVA